MKRLLLIMFAFSLFSCAPKITQIKSKYLDGPYVINSDKSFNEVWDKLIDFFAQKGLSIKIIDRSSGLIVSDKSRLTWSRESKTTGKLVDSLAFVVIERIYDPGTKKNINPTNIIGDWNVRIKSAPDGKSIINVNLVNIIAYREIPSTKYSNSSLLVIEAESTGNFEKMISNLIK